MDKTQIFTLVITALITAVIKEIISAVIRRFPAISRKIGSSLLKSLQTTMRKYWRSLFDLASLVFTVTLIQSWVQHNGVRTTGSVFMIAYLAAWFIYWTTELKQDIRTLNRTTSEK